MPIARTVKLLVVAHTTQLPPSYLPTSADVSKTVLHKNFHPLDGLLQKETTYIQQKPTAAKRNLLSDVASAQYLVLRTNRFT